MVCDDIFGLRPGWVHAFADLVEKEKILSNLKCREGRLVVARK